jgi:magnesium-transporting ATPase (P-type)
MILDNHTTIPHQGLQIQHGAANVAGTNNKYSGIQNMKVDFTLKWWYVVILLLVIPFIYGYFRKEGDYDLMLDAIVVFVASWCIAIGIILAKLLF